MSADEKEPAATAISQRLAPGGGGGGCWLGGPKTESSEKSGHTGEKKFHLLGTDLFGDEIKADAAGALRERFDFPPFSVLNAREGPWQERKRAWLSVGIQSELGRGATPESYPNAATNLEVGEKGLSAALANNKGRPRNASPGGSPRPAMDYSNRERGNGTGKPLSQNMAFKPPMGEYEYPVDALQSASGTSIFDPVLTEMCYRWFCPKGGLILDPFAGGSVRGIVAGLLGYRYHGIDLRPEQIHANEVQRAEIVPEADITWHVGDSNLLLPEAPEADFLFSCPPYGDLEQYSDDPADLSNMTWEQFLALYRSIIQQALARLNSNRFACFVVGEYRDKNTGLYRGFVPQTVQAFLDGGAAFYNEGILITAVGSLPIRITKQFEAGRKLGKTHQNVLIFCKGDPRLATEAISGAEQGKAARPATRLAAPGAPPDAPAPTGPSALAFVAGLAEPAKAITPTEPLKPIEPIPFDASSFKDSLARKGHRLLTRDGRFFVSEASTLTDVERAEIKAHRDELVALAEPWTDETRRADGDAQQSRLSEDAPDNVGRDADAGPAQVLRDGGDGVRNPSLARQAGSEPAESLFSEPRPQQTLAQFLNDELPRVDVDYVPDELPDLTGIDEVVLNFATTGLNWHAGDRPCGVTVATMDGQLCRFLPFGFAGGNLDEAAVKRWAQEQLRGKKIYNSKTKFDVHMARGWGVDLEAQGCTFSDVQHTAALLDDHRKRFALDVLAADYFPGEMFALRLDETQHHRYGAAQAAERERETARLVGRLRAAMQPELERQELLAVQQLEDDCIPAVVEMERNGSPIDLALLEQYHAECLKRHDALLWEVAKECGFAFDHTAKAWQRLFESLGLPPTDGNDEAIVGAIDHPTVKKAHLAAQYASLDSKCFKAYLENVDSDSILRVDINQLRNDDGGTVSGRFSIGYVQQVPNHDNHSAVFGDELFPRRLFIAAGAADYLEADAMQIEQRLLVHYMDNAEIIRQYDGDLERLRRGEEPVSFHKVTWAMMKRYKPDMLYSHQKSFNFAKQYGARSIKLAVMMGFITEVEGDEIRRAKRWNDPRLKTIKEIEAAYRRMVPEGDALLDRAAHLAKPACDEFCKHDDALHRRYPHCGYVKTYVGRRSRFPNAYKTYIGLNRVLQGTGADVMKRKLAELHRERKHTGLVMRLTVHDAVGGDATLPETRERVSEVLNAQSYPFKVPILWSVKTGVNWAECK